MEETKYFKTGMVGDGKSIATAFRPDIPDEVPFTVRGQDKEGNVVVVVTKKEFTDKVLKHPKILELSESEAITTITAMREANKEVDKKDVINK